MTGILLAAALASSASSAEAVLHSGPSRARLIELYSSEGCSSCPPADAWISTLVSHPRLWKDFVPVVFHVTYWDYLGWKDRFAQPAYDARQRAYAASWGSRTTYTPGLTLDGEEWRAWGDAPPEAGGSAGTLSATLGAKKIVVRFLPAEGAGPFEVFAARLGFGASSNVTDGENAGRVLRHDFVARGVSHAAMTRAKDGTWAARLTPPPASGPPVEREGIAVWVVGADGRPLQAAGASVP
jgi:hypothetical protein